MVKVTVKKAEQHGNGKTVLKGRASKVSLKLKKKVFKWIWKEWDDVDGMNGVNEGDELMLDWEEQDELKKVFKTKKEMYKVIKYLLEKSVINGPSPKEAEKCDDFSYEWTSVEDFVRYMMEEKTVKWQIKFMRKYNGSQAAEAMGFYLVRPHLVRVASHNLPRTEILKEDESGEEGGEALYCEGCDNADEFSSLQEAYDHGWHRSEDADYCPKCAYAEILKEDEKNKSS